MFLGNTVNLAVKKVSVQFLKNTARVTLGLSRSLWRMLGFIFHILYDPCVCPLDTSEPFHLVRNEPQWLPDEAAGCEAHKQLAKNYS